MTLETVLLSSYETSARKKKSIGFVTVFHFTLIACHAIMPCLL
jgi:hypothetical protein